MQSEAKESCSTISYLLGSSGSIQDERREVLLPMLLHPEPIHVCCIGLATGNLGRRRVGRFLDESIDCD